MNSDDDFFNQQPTQDIDKKFSNCNSEIMSNILRDNALEYAKKKYG